MARTSERTDGRSVERNEDEDGAATCERARFWLAKLSGFGRRHTDKWRSVTTIMEAKTICDLFTIHTVGGHLSGDDMRPNVGRVVVLC